MRTLHVWINRVVRNHGGLVAYFRGLKTVGVYLAVFVLLFLMGGKLSHAGTINYTTFAQAQTGCYEKHAELTAAGLPLSPVWSPLCAAVDGTNQLQSYYHNQYNNGAPNYDQSWVFKYSANENNPCTAPTSGSGFWTCPAYVPGKTPAQCAAQPDHFTTNQYTNGALMCDPASGCLFEAINNNDGGEVLLFPYESSAGVGDACIVSEVSTGNTACPTGFLSVNHVGWMQNECLPNGGDADGDGIANLTDTTPNEPGSTTHDSDSDGVPDSQDAMPNDPLNGKDTTGTESDNTSTGGGSCEQPPVSNGDGIAAQVAYQTWATRCAVERLKDVTVSQGTSAGGLSAGDSTKLTAIQNNTATAAGNAGAAAANAAAIANILQTGDSSTPGAGRGSDGMPASGEAANHNQETEYGAGGLDQSGMGFGNTCPQMPSLMILGSELTFDTSLFCDWMTASGYLVFLFAAMGCLRILGGSA